MTKTEIMKQDTIVIYDILPSDLHYFGIQINGLDTNDFASFRIGFGGEKLSSTIEQLEHICPPQQYSDTSVTIACVVFFIIGMIIGKFIL